MVMGRSGSQTDLPKGNLKSKLPQIWDSHILPGCWQNQFGFMIQHLCPSLLSDNLPFDLLNYQNFFSLCFAAGYPVKWAHY